MCIRDRLKDYGASWRILRPQSVTDQILIKAKRIRSIEEKGVSLIDEGIAPEFIGIVNYGIIGLMQLELGFSDSIDITEDQALALYDLSLIHILFALFRVSNILRKPRVFVSFNDV